MGSCTSSQRIDKGNTARRGKAPHPPGKAPKQPGKARNPPRSGKVATLPPQKSTRSKRPQAVQTGQPQPFGRKGPSREQQIKEYWEDFDNECNRLLAPKRRYHDDLYFYPTGRNGACCDNAEDSQECSEVIIAAVQDTLMNLKTAFFIDTK